ncbi:hypothetical protein H6G28_14155 [Nostoc sp. FACHB-190]|nr:hypothetical protein [Nostoc sp. FACHB-190]
MLFRTDVNVTIAGWCVTQREDLNVVISQETHCVESEMGVSSKPKAKAFFLRLLTTRSRYRCS